MHSYRTVFGLLAVVGFALGGLVFSGSVDADEKADEKGFVPLYNGKDLSGWEVLDGSKEAWKADGELLSCVAAGGGWLRTDKMYSDFVLKLEFRLPANGNSGVGLRFPAEGNPAFVGMEIQILDDDGDEYTEPQGFPIQRQHLFRGRRQTRCAETVGEFNSYEITCNGPFIKVVLNGETITEADIDKYEKASGDYQPLRDRPRIGYIGMQSHGSRVDFRNIAIKDLTKTITDPDTNVDHAICRHRRGQRGCCRQGDVPTIHCTGRFLNGQKFYSSHDRTANRWPRPLTRYIRGWQLGIPGMKVGRTPQTDHPLSIGVRSEREEGRRSLPRRR